MIGDYELMKIINENRVEDACSSSECKKRVRGEFFLKGSSGSSKRKNESMLCKIGLC